MSMFVIDKAYLVKDPQTRTIGEGATQKTIVTLTVADNPRGERAKARYVSLFIDLDFTGRDADFAAGLKKGSAIASAGRLGIRTYEKKDGTTGFQGEISFPFYLTAVGAYEEKAADADPVPEMPATAKKGKAKADPFA